MQVLFNSCSLTDVGCTYRIVHREPMLKILDKAQVSSNFFGPEMMLLSILMKMKIIQIPVNYKDRIGKSSVTGSLKKTIILGIQMIVLIISTRLLSLNISSYIDNKIGIYQKK